VAVLQPHSEQAEIDTTNGPKVRKAPLTVPQGRWDRRLNCESQAVAVAAQWKHC